MKTSTSHLVKLGLLTAVVILMAFTPLGYLKTGGLEITFITIPVVVGAVLMGPAAGAILGAVFGLTSFIQCFGMSPFGAALLSIDPFAAFLVSVPTRVLMGYLTGLLFRLLLKGKKGEKSDAAPTGRIAAASLAGPLLNTLLFMTALMAFYGNSDFIRGLMGDMSPLPFVAAFVGINGLVEAGASFVISTAVCRALYKYMGQGQ